MILTPATPAHLDRVMELEERGFPPEIRESRRVFAARLRDFPRGFLVCLDSPGNGGAQAYGYFYAEVWAGGRQDFALGHDPGACVDPGGSTLYVASMTLDPERRGGGLGRQLFHQGLAAMQAGFPRLERALLMVREDWTGARRIYQEAGFREVDRRPDLLPGGAALIMALDLGPGLPRR